MITSFKSLGQSGGGGGYVLPTATPTRLGGVKIGQGINVDSAGTISVSGSDVANYAMALKSINVEDENNYKIINDAGWLYYIDDYKNATENILVKVRYYIGRVEINIDIDGQTDTDIMGISNSDFQFTISIDEFGELFYFNGEENIYFNSEVLEYQYGEFTFNWSNDGKYISFSQQAHSIEVNVLTDNCEYWYCVGQETHIANEEQLGFVKIGEGIDLAEDGTISVSGGTGGIEVVTELPASGTDGQVVVLEETDARAVAYSPDVENDTTVVSVTAVGFTERTLIWTWEWFGEYVPMYVNPDNSVTLTDSNGETILNIQVGDTDEYTFADDHLGTQTINISVDETGFVSETTMGIAKENPHPTVIPEKKDTEYIWDAVSKTCEIKHIEKEGQPTQDIVTYFGELPEGEPIFRQWHPYWNAYYYLAFDGEQIKSYREPELINETDDSIFATFGETEIRYGDVELRTFTEGMIVCTHNLDWTLEVYGNWADAGDGHWKPLDYDTIKNNALQASEKNCYTRLVAPDYFDIGFANVGTNGGYHFIYTPTNGGSKGMFLQASGNDRAPVWTEFKPVKVLSTLPAYANEGDIVILSPISEIDNGSFVSLDSTSEPNNFDFDNELGNSGDGEYLCFVNDGYDYSNVPNKTLIAVIQMRTDESSEWNNDHIEEAYIYFNSADDGGSWVQYYSLEYSFMKTIEGQPVQFDGYFTVDDNNTTVDSDWLNIWNDSYGYKFNLEYVEGDTQNYLYFRSVYSSEEGEDSGDVNVRIHYYTKQFKTGLLENCEPSEFYIFNNGIWIKLGKTEEPQV